MKYLFAALILVLSVVVVTPATADAQAATVRLNEVQSSNQTTLADAAGEHPDWIELFNPTGVAVDLSGWGLSDDADELLKWQFPAGTSIASGAYLVVFASGDDTTVNGELHTNFQLAVSGEFVGLSDPSETLLSSFNPVPSLTADVSWGVGPDGGLYLFDPATPGSVNGSGSFGFVGDVELSPERGFYSAPISVTLTADAGASIRYTLDGTTPSASHGAVYSAPIPISETTVLRAIGVRNGWTSPQPVTSTYVFASDIASQPRMDAALAGAHASEIEASLLELPAISLTSADETNAPRFSWSQIDEAGLAVEMIHPDGTPGFQVDAGVREVGGATVRYPKDSLRLIFGAEFGESELNYPVFAGADLPNAPAVTSFKRLTLQTSAQDGFFWDAPTVGPYRSYLRRSWHDLTMLELGHPGLHIRFVNVFLNGEYWGLYQLREHADDHFMASYFGGNNEQYVGVNGGEIRSGSGTSWDALNAAAGSWPEFSQIVDPVNYVDFMLVNEYTSNNFDLRAEGNTNWRATGPATAGTNGVGYQFFHNDPDGAMVSTTAALAMPARSVFTGPADSWELLQEEAHPAFLALVEERAELLLLEGGVLSPENAQQRWDERAAQISNAVHAENARWETPLGPVDWLNSMAWFRDVYFPVRAANTIEILQGKGLLSANPGDGLQAPSFMVAPGAVPYGTEVGVDAGGQPGTIWYTTDGSDPRAADGTISPDAQQYTGSVSIAGKATLHARILDGADWSPPSLQVYTLSAPAGPIRVLVNEFNAVSSQSYLGGGGAGDVANGSDVTLGRVAGNGGDWFELVIIEDGLDLRGWTMQIWNEDEGIPTLDAELTLTNSATLGDLRAGTILTISESLADDTSFDPRVDDWHMNVQSNSAGDGAFITAASQTNFAINGDNTQIAILDAAGLPAALATGEGTASNAFVSSTEVFKLEGTPDTSIEPISTEYRDGTSSTWGQPNAWNGGLTSQDLSALRFIPGDVNCSGTVTVADAVVIAQAMVGLRTDSGGCPLADASAHINMVAADGDFNGTVTIADAVLVAQCTAQLPNALCPEN